MEKVEQKICLDTDVIIAILNNEDRAIQILEKIKECEVFVSVISLFELLLRETNLDKIEMVRDRVEIVEFNEQASRKASSIFKDLKKIGKLIDIRDVFIAAICITQNYELATFNKKHFENIKELRIIH